MKQSAEIIQLGFSVADAESIQFSFDGSTLTLKFKDWQEKSIEVKCENTLGFKYQRAEYFISENESYDSAHEIKNSEWVASHIKQSEVWQGESWVHYKLNFNAAGVVEVLCSRIVKT